MLKQESDKNSFPLPCGITIHVVYANIKLIHTQKLVFITLELQNISHIGISDKSFPLESHGFLYILGIYDPVFSKNVVSEMLMHGKGSCAYFQSDLTMLLIYL